MRNKLKSILRKFGFHIEQESKKFFDVICGMELGIGTIKQAVEHKGETYYFCSKSCKNHFINDPKKYVG